MAFKESEVFVNLSASEKAINFKVGERRFTLALSHINKLKKGEVKALKLTEMIDEVEEQQKVEE